MAKKYMLKGWDKKGKKFTKSDYDRSYLKRNTKKPYSFYERFYKKLKKQGKI